MRTVWHIVKDDRNWFVEKDSRTVYVGSYDECEDYVRNNRSPKDAVTRIEEDGYRWDLSTHLR